MTGAAGISGRAMAQLGTRFRLYGRLPGVGLDCIGLVAVAIEKIAPPDLPVPSGYRMRGDFDGHIFDYFAKAGFRRLGGADDMRDGDILAVHTAPRQQHLMIRTQGGFVHAHAGLGKVTHMPGPLPWAVTARFRWEGE